MTTVDEIMQLCRLCLVKDQVNVSIFDEETEMQKIFTKINTLLPVKVAKNDNLPKKICDDCSFKLDMLYIFRKKSAESEKQLNVWLASGSKDPKPEVLVKQETFESAESRTDDEHVGAAAYLMQQELEELDESALEEEPARKRIKRTPKSAAETDEDEFDDSMITKAEDDDSDDLDQGDYAEDPSLGTDDEQPGPSGVAKGTTETPASIITLRWFCKRCPLRFRIRSELTEHGKIHRMDKSGFRFVENTQSYMCKICSENFPTSNEAEAHILEKHSTVYTCDICKQTFEEPAKFSVHMDTHDNFQNYKCPMCSYETPKNFSMTFHINRQHLGKHVYYCDTCGKGFGNLRSYEEHKNLHLGVKPFACVVCSQTFTFSSLLRRHQIRSHRADYESTLKSTQCHVCRKVLTSVAKLEKHMSTLHVHESVNRWVCSTCGRGFPNGTLLRNHENKHTGTRPHKCQYCEKGFTAVRHLREHERTHTGEKPFKCDICEKCFSQKTPLNIHKRIHTGERPYVCKLCKKGFISRSALNTHMKRCLLI